MELGLKNKWVLVTGSSRGIGRAIAEAFLNEKANVILTGRDKKSLNETAAAFNKQYKSSKVHEFAGNLQDEKEIAKLAKEVKEKIGALDHLVCNIGSGKSVPVLEENVKEFQRMLDINLLSAVGAVNAFLPLLEKKSSSTESKTITFIGSICGTEALGCPAGYAAAKAALEVYAKTIARPLGKKGIRVNIVLPGNIMFSGSTWEEKVKKNRAGVEEMLRRDVPLERLGTPEDVANTVVFLASERAGFVAGASWVVDGGQTRKF